MTLQTVINTQVILSSIILLGALIYYLTQHTTYKTTYKKLVGATFLILPGLILLAFSTRYPSLTIYTAGLLFLGTFFLFGISFKQLKQHKNNKIHALISLAKEYREDPDKTFFTNHILRAEFQRYATTQQAHEKLKQEHEKLQERYNKRQEDYKQLAEKTTTKLDILKKKEKDIQNREKELKKQYDALKDEQEEIKEELEDVNTLKNNYEKKLKELDDQENAYIAVLKTQKTLHEKEDTLKKQEEKIKTREQTFRDYYKAKMDTLKAKEQTLKELQKKLKAKEEDLEDREDDIIEKEQKLGGKK